MGGGGQSYASIARRVYDVTGAGDTVVAALSLALAAGAALEQAARLANAAAGIVVGCVVTGPTGKQARVRFLVDSGATYILLPHEAWRTIGPVAEAVCDLHPG